jgi:hypothetical protein
LLLFLFLSLPVRHESLLPDTTVVVGYSHLNVALSYPGSRVCARDSRGYIYVAYAETSAILVKLSTDQGQTWTLIGTLIYPTSYYSEIANPSVAIASGDSLFVAWHQDHQDTNSIYDYDIFVSRYDGTSWTPAQNISDSSYPGNDAAMYPCLASAPGARLHCVWHRESGSSGGVYYAGYQAGAWSRPTKIADAGLIAYPSMVADTSGDLYLVYMYNRINYKKRTNGIWSPAEFVSPSSGGSPSIVVGRFNVPHVVYYAWNDSISLDIFYQYRVGSGWSSPQNISNNNGISQVASLSIDSNNYLYAAWMDNANDTTIGRAQIFYATCDTLWSSPAVISPDSSFPPHSWITLGFPVSFEGVDAVWQRDLRYHYTQILYRRLPPLGSGVEVGNQRAYQVESIELNVQSPARQELRLSYVLPSRSRITLTLYDISGRKAAVLDEGEKPPGGYEVRHPLRLPSGVYFLRLEDGKEALTRKLVVLR